MNDLYGRLKIKKIKLTEIPKWGPYLRKQWESNFANHLSDKDKKSIYLFDTGGYCGYLWHLFSYEKLHFWIKRNGFFLTGMLL
jgi:hypothetical protein